jgi:3-oxoacyl-[acyl-carrier protein] reductase
MLTVRADGFELNLAEPEAPAKLFDRVEKSLGMVDIVVNNAAHSERDGIDALTAELFDRHYAVNLRAMALICAEFVRRFRKQNGGRIMNLTSGQSISPMPAELAYAATKGAIEAFTKSLSVELAPRGITVNAVDPGPTDTGWMSPDLKEKLESTAPMGRIGLPEDAARIVRFLFVLTNLLTSPFKMTIFS